MRAPFVRPRHTILGIPAGRRSFDWERAMKSPAIGRAAGASMALAAAGYVGWSVIRSAAAVRRSVTSVARTVEVGADQLTSKLPEGKRALAAEGKQKPKTRAAH